MSTPPDIIALKERVAQLERECGKWKTQAEIAKEQSTAFLTEIEELRKVLILIAHNTTDETAQQLAAEALPTS